MSRMEGGKVRNKLLTYRHAAQGDFHLGADVTDAAFRVWHVLLSYADKDGYNARPTSPVLATQTRRSVSTVQRALKELEDKGAIVRKDGTGAGRGNAAVYTVLPLPGATSPASTAPRFGRRLFARVNGALREIGCELLSVSRWLDPDDVERVSPATTFPDAERVSPATTFPESENDGKGVTSDAERVSPVTPHQSNYQGTAAGRETSDPERNDSVAASEDRPAAGGPPADQRAHDGRGLLDNQQQRDAERPPLPVEPPPDEWEDELPPDPEGDR